MAQPGGLLRLISRYATIVGKSEENRRQIARRARQHLKARRSHDEVSSEQREQLIHQFIHASGDMDGLLTLLTDDVVLYSDGGGRVAAALNPIYRPSKVARGILVAAQGAAQLHLVRGDGEWSAGAGELPQGCSFRCGGTRFGRGSHPRD
jgi:RNA polymerase sigma-70 factor (ECF subfamily)